MLSNYEKLRERVEAYENTLKTIPDDGHIHDLLKNETHYYNHAIIDIEGKISLLEQILKNARKAGLL